jgi:tetratricopeptide (TPR) repeat protein
LKKIGKTKHSRETPGRVRASAGSASIGFAWLPAAALVVAIIIAYLPALRSGYIWDDPRYVTDNPTLRSLAGLFHTWFTPGATVQYYPMVFTTFWLEHHLWGIHPFGYHLVNVLLHAASAVLLLIVLRRLRVPGAFPATVLWALHPVQVESVAWITERKNVLSGLFYLAAALSWLGYARPEQAEPPLRGRSGPYAAALIFFVLALFSKTVTASLPAAALLLLYWKRGRITRRDVIPLLPFFAAALAMGSVTSWMERTVVGARGPEWDLSFAQRLLIAGKALWFYLGKLLWPARLIFNYPRWVINTGSGAAWLLLGSALLVPMVLFSLRHRVGRGPLVAFLFFGGTLFPALGFVNVYPMRYSFVADHFQYLACIGPFALLAAVGAESLLGKADARSGHRTSAPRTTAGVYAASAVLAVLLGAVTWRQAVPYRDLPTLWQDTLRKNPSSFLAHHNLAVGLIEDNRPDEAIVHLREAVRLKPDFYEARCALGSALVRKQRLADAREQLVTARDLRPDKEWAYIYLGDALVQERHLEEARQQYEQALAVRPTSGLARMNLATVLSQLGLQDAAIPLYREILRGDQNNAMMRRNLALALSARGDADEAVVEYREVLRVAPRDLPARFNLAELLAKRGETAAAAQEYREVLRLDPRFAPAKAALDSLNARGAGGRSLGDPAGIEVGSP